MRNTTENINLVKINTLQLCSIKLSLTSKL